MHSKGWFRLYRKIIDSKIFKNEKLLKVWIWCLCQAKYEDAWVSVSTYRRQIEVFLERGQFLFGRKIAAKELDMPESTVRNKIEKLRSMGKLTVQRNAHYSIISIVNYDIYQNDKEKEDNQKTGKDQPKTTKKKNSKKGKGGSSIDLILEHLPEEWRQSTALKKILKEYAMHRKEIHKPITPRAGKMIANKLSKHNKREVIMALRRSIENGWTGVFPESVEASKTKSKHNRAGGDYDQYGKQAKKTALI